jgi:hypothetical protein
MADHTLVLSGVEDVRLLERGKEKVSDNMPILLLFKSYRSWLKMIIKPTFIP